jgi:hypothetical protein
MRREQEIVDEEGAVIGYTLDDKGKPPKVFKYDGPIDDFLECQARSRVIHHRNPAYLRTQLNRRIRARRIPGIRATVIGGKLYLRRDESSSSVSVSS